MFKGPYSIYSDHPTISDGLPRRTRELPLEVLEREASLLTVAARSKAWVCGRSFTGIAGSNPARGMDVCLL
jgi:hypothetical protein